MGQGECVSPPSQGPCSECRHRGEPAGGDGGGPGLTKKHAEQPFQNFQRAKCHLSLSLSIQAARCRGSLLAGPACTESARNQLETASAGDACPKDQRIPADAHWLPGTKTAQPTFELPKQCQGHPALCLKPLFLPQIMDRGSPTPERAEGGWAAGPAQLQGTEGCRTAGGPC